MNKQNAENYTAYICKCLLLEDRKGDVLVRLLYLDQWNISLNEIDNAIDTIKLIGIKFDVDVEQDIESIPTEKTEKICIIKTLKAFNEARAKFYHLYMRDSTLQNAINKLRDLEKELIKYMENLTKIPI